MNLYDRAESMRQLQLRLVNIKNSSIYINNVSVHILPIKKTISSNNWVDYIDMEKYQNIRVPPGVKGAQIISFKEGLYLSTLQQSKSSAYEPLYLIEIELSQDAFKHALAQFNTYNGSASFLISLANNSIISNQSNTGAVLTSKEIIDDLNKDNSGGMEFAKINDKGYYIAHAKSDYLNMFLLKYIPEEFIFKPIQNFYVWVWVFSIAAVSIILIYSFSTYKFIHKPLLELVKSFRKVENSDLKVSINNDSNNEFRYLYERFNDMVRNLNMLIDQVYNQKILMQRVELK